MMAPEVNSHVHAEDDRAHVRRFMCVVYAGLQVDRRLNAIAVASSALLGWQDFRGEVKQGKAQQGGCATVNPLPLPRQRRFRDGRRYGSCARRGRT